MPQAPGRMNRRHVREKSVIDHLAEKVFDRGSGVDERDVHSPKTSTGLPVEEQVRKEWNPRKGGLPILSGKAGIETRPVRPGFT
jgi:hypothetical protein